MVPLSSHKQVKKLYVNENLEDQELLTLDAISPKWAKRLEASKLLPLFSIERLQLYLNLGIPQGVWSEKHTVFLHHMYMTVNGVLKLVGSLCFIL